MARNVVNASEFEADLEETYDQASVESAVKKIMAAHKRGQSSIKRHGEWLHTKANKIIPTIAAERGYRRHSVERARQFARVFTQADVRQICRECREHGFPLGVTLIYRSLFLGDSDKCMQLLRRAIRGKWTQRRMNAELHDRPGAISHTGRPRALPKSQTEARQQIVSRFGPGVRWLKELKSSMDGQLGASLRRKIDTAVIALEALVEAAS